MTPLLALLLCLGFVAPPLQERGFAPDPGSADERAPNIVLIVLDDAGYGDLGCYGARPAVTPHLDALAASGLRATDFYVAQPVCSASRAAILTGCYPNRIGIAGALDPRTRVGLAATETTIAELCKSRGYATAAIGKWHLGHQVEFLPTRHGFDEYFGIPYSNDMGAEHPSNPPLYPPLPLLEGERVVETEPDQDALTRRFTDRAIDFLARCETRPFFLYLAHPMPHVPLHVAAERRGSTGFGLYADVLAELDDSVGAIVAKLDELSLRNDTLVIVTSDNGPWLSFGNHAGSAGVLREGKGTTFDGGVRVPCIVSWPAKIEAGRVFRSPWMTIDLLPTVARAIGADLPAIRLDGISVYSALVAKGDAPQDPILEERPLFFWYQENDLEAMRLGRFKLHFPHRYRTMLGNEPGKDGESGRYGRGEIGLALFDLVDDPGEKNDLAKIRPNVVAELEELARAARRELGDALRDKPGRERREPGRVER